MRFSLPSDRLRLAGDFSRLVVGAILSVSCPLENSGPAVGSSTWLKGMEEPLNFSSVAGLMRLSAKLVFAEVFAEVPTVVSLEVKDSLDQKLSLALVELLLALLVIFFITSGEVGALGDDGPAPLSTLRNKRRTGSGSDNACVVVELARCEG